MTNKIKIETTCDGQAMNNKAYDYSGLGETWSTPRIIRLRISNKDKWVAVFGGGYNGGVNPNVGSAVFVMDLENEGKLLKVIDIEDQANINHRYKSDAQHFSGFDT